MGPDSNADAELLEKIRRGDDDAFDEFVASYGDRIFGFGMKVCGEREDARDVFQDTLLQAYRSLTQLREPRALRSWLYRVVSNACLMRRRKGKYEPARELSLEELKPRDAGEATAEIPDLADRPDDALARNELRAAVRRAIDQLPMHYRVVLALRDMEQLSTRETAEVLELPQSTVKMRLHRARLMVRRILAAEVGAGAEPEGAS